jgi:hypothetical protein
MLEFALDHVVIRTPDRDGLAAEIASAAGLSILQGYAAGGQVRSRGVRFANGPFLDIFHAEAPATALILAGSVDAVERHAEPLGWAARIARREATPPGRPVYPWSMAYFRRGQGLLTQVSVIDYAHDPQAWAEPDYAGELYKPGMALDAAANLSGVWLSAQDVARAERDLAVLGYAFLDEVTSAYWPHAGRRLSGLAADLLLFESPHDGVARLDIATGAPRPTEIPLLGAPRLVLNEDL